MENCYQHFPPRFVLYLKETLYLSVIYFQVVFSFISHLYLQTMYIVHAVKRIFYLFAKKAIFKKSILSPTFRTIIYFHIQLGLF